MTHNNNDDDVEVERQRENRGISNDLRPLSGEKEAFWGPENFKG